jgi:hypothetical protein
MLNGRYFGPIITKVGMFQQILVKIRDTMFTKIPSVGVHTYEQKNRQADRQTDVRRPAVARRNCFVKVPGKEIYLC